MDGSDGQIRSSGLTIPQEGGQDGVVSLRPIYGNFVLMRSAQSHLEMLQSDCDGGEHTGESLIHSLTEV